ARLGGGGRCGPAIRAAAVLAAAALVGPLDDGNIRGRSPSLPLWPPRARSPDGPWCWRREPRVASGLVALAEVVKPGQDVLVFPPNRNDVHYILGTTSRSFPIAYSWAPRMGTFDDVRWETLDAVIFVRFGERSFQFLSDGFHWPEARD